MSAAFCSRPVYLRTAPLACNTNVDVGTNEPTWLQWPQGNPWSSARVRGEFALNICRFCTVGTAGLSANAMLAFVATAWTVISGRSSQEEGEQPPPPGKLNVQVTVSGGGGALTEQVVGLGLMCFVGSLSYIPVPVPRLVTF